MAHFSASSGSVPFGVPSALKVSFSTRASACFREPVAMVAQSLAALVDRDALLELDVAALEPADDGLELLERALEAHVLDVGMLPGGLCGAHVLPDRSSVP